MFRMFPYNNNNGNNNNINFFDNLVDSLMNDNFFNNMVDQFLSSDLMNNLTEDFLQDEEYNIEFQDYGDYYTIKGYLPGLTAKDISIDFEENKAILTIKRKRVYSNESNTVFAMIKCGGDVIRTFYVEEIDVTKLRASFDDNLLVLALPKMRKKIEGKDDTVIIDVDDYRTE